MNSDINVCQRAIGAGQGRNRRWSWPTAQSALVNGAIGVGQQRNWRRNGAIGVGQQRNRRTPTSALVNTHHRWPTPLANTTSSVGHQHWPTAQSALANTVNGDCVWPSQRRLRCWPTAQSAVDWAVGGHPVNVGFDVGHQPREQRVGVWQFRR